MGGKEPLSVHDCFAIFEQPRLHQRHIDNDASLASARSYVDLYLPEAKFTMLDLRHMTFKGPEGLKQFYDYARSVFPIHKWFHTEGNLRNRRGRR